MPKLIYPDGKIRKALTVPKDFTGIIENAYLDKFYWLNGQWHRDGGLPAVVWVDGRREYWVNNKITGTFFGG
jgi:hypothetical protein